MHEEPVEILVGMAESGEIDPWNIDIVEVTDRFFSELERLKELDLRISGRTLFFAATLLRMKSEYLNEVADDFSDNELDDELDEYNDEFAFDGEFSSDDVADPIERLEREIQRRVGRKKQRKRPVTLYELIQELKTAEKMQRRRVRKQNVEIPVQIEVDDVIDFTHEEDFLEETQSVLNGFHRIKKDLSCISLTSLCSEMGRERHTVYLPLLFLMHEGNIFMEQDDLFGEIRISEWRAEAFEDE